METKTVAIIGCGQVGSTVAYTLYMYNFCDIILVNHNKVKAISNVADILDCEIERNAHTIFAGDYEDIKDVDIVINCAGDSSLLRSGNRDSEFFNSSRIAYDIINNLNKVGFHGIFINVMNPCDEITSLFKDLDTPTSKIMGTGTMLETLRLRRIVYDRYGKITNSYVVGNHGTNNIIVPEDFMLKLSSADIEHILSEVQNRVWKIYEGKGFTNFGISNVLLQLVQTIVYDLGDVYCVANLVNPISQKSGNCISVPCVIDSSGIIGVGNCDKIKKLFRKEAEV